MPSKHKSKRVLAHTTVQAYLDSEDSLILRRYEDNLLDLVAHPHASVFVNHLACYSYNYEVQANNISKDAQIWCNISGVDCRKHAMTHAVTHIILRFSLDIRCNCLIPRGIMILEDECLFSEDGSLKGDELLHLAIQVSGPVFRPIFTQPLFERQSQMDILLRGPAHS